MAGRQAMPRTSDWAVAAEGQLITTDLEVLCARLTAVIAAGAPVPSDALNEISPLIGRIAGGAYFAAAQRPTSPKEAA